MPPKYIAWLTALARPAACARLLPPRYIAPSPGYIDNGLGELVRSLTRLGSLERLFGLDREAEGNLRRTVENLQDMIAEQAPVLALGAAYGIQFNAAVASIAFGTGDVGPSHPGYMPPIVGRCKPVAPPKGLSSAGLTRLSGILLFELDLLERNRFPIVRIMPWDGRGGS
jgi:hypothetical protein